MRWWYDQKGETTLGNVVFALITTITLVLVVNIGMMLFTYIELIYTKDRAERAMEQDGGYTQRVQELIESNLSGKLDLSLLTVTATPYPVNRGEDLSIEIRYDYPFGYLGVHGSATVFENMTIPMIKRAFGRSDAVIR